MLWTVSRLKTVLLNCLIAGLQGTPDSSNDPDGIGLSDSTGPPANTGLSGPTGTTSRTTSSTNHHQLTGATGTTGLTGESGPVSSVEVSGQHSSPVTSESTGVQGSAGL